MGHLVLIMNPKNIISLPTHPSPEIKIYPWFTRHSRVFMNYNVIALVVNNTGIVQQFGQHYRCEWDHFSIRDKHIIWETKHDS